MTVLDGTVGRQYHPPRLDLATMTAHPDDPHFIARRRTGLALITVANISRHTLLRPVDDAHLARLCTSLRNDPNARHAHPLQVVPTETVSVEWLDRLSRAAFLSAHDADALFLCIGGGHRLLAAAALNARPAPENGPDERPLSWLCEVYSGGECRRPV